MSKPWMCSDVERLKKLWKTTPKGFLIMSFPNRSWNAIQQKAQELGLKRARVWRGRTVPVKDPLMHQLRTVRVDKDLTCAQLSRKIGRTERYIGLAERGHMNVKHHTLLKWCAALGVKLEVSVIKGGFRDGPT